MFRCESIESPILRYPLGSIEASADEQLLQGTESAITLAKISYLDMNPLPGAYDFEHYREIHRFLFSDLYDWAGELRMADLSKRERPLWQ